MTDHFQGKPVIDHLKEARKRGSLATYETHGTELPGHLSAGADSAKETAVVLALLWVLFEPHLGHLFLLFSIGWILWKIARSAFLGWARLERLHRLIEEERWEIEHNREQEKQELKALYRAKGITGKLLDEVTSVLMADDNRLLRIMLEEELGLTLEVYEHPLKQSAGAALGVLIAALFFLGSAYLLPPYAPLIFAGLVLAAASYVAAKVEKSRTLEAVIWNVSMAAFATAVVYFLKDLL